MKSILDYPELIEGVADTLFLNLEHYPNKDLHDLFYIKRKADAEQLSSRLFEVNCYGGNVLVIGEPGIGKTVFLSHFSDDMRKRLGPKVINTEQIDFRVFTFNPEKREQFFDSFLLQLGNIFVRHLDKALQDPCNDSPDRTKDGKTLFNWGAKKFSDIGRPIEKPDEESCFFFIDDVDYLPEDVFNEILEHLRPFLISQYFCVILACRVPAYNTIQSHYDTSLSTAFIDSRKITLKPIEVHRILEARLNDLTTSGTTFRELIKKRHYIHLMSKLYQSFQNAVTTLPDGEDIECFEYPFTDKQHHFMSMYSNGNTRHILIMAQTILKEMSRKKSHLKKNGSGYSIGRENLLELFQSLDIPEAVRIFDINKKKTYQYKSAKKMADDKFPDSLKGNTIDVLILEAVDQTQYPNTLDESVFRYLLEEYGLQRDEAIESFRRLQQIGLIRPRILRTRVALGSTQPEFDFELTLRGQYYLHYMIHWDAYIEKYGISKHLEAYESRETILKLETELLKFSASILVYVERTKKRIVDFKISKSNLASLFESQRAAYLLSLNETNKKESLSITADLLTKYLKDRLGIVTAHKIDENKNFLFTACNLVSVLRKRSIPKKMHDVFNENEFVEILDRMISYPDYV